MASIGSSVSVHQHPLGFPHRPHEERQSLTAPFRGIPLKHVCDPSVRRGDSTREGTARRVPNRPSTRVYPSHHTGDPGGSHTPSGTDEGRMRNTHLHGYAHRHRRATYRGWTRPHSATAPGVDALRCSAKRPMTARLSTGYSIHSHNGQSDCDS